MVRAGGEGIGNAIRGLQAAHRGLEAAIDAADEQGFQNLSDDLVSYFVEVEELLEDIQILQRAWLKMKLQAQGGTPVTPPELPRNR